MFVHYFRFTVVAIITAFLIALLAAVVAARIVRGTYDFYPQDSSCEPVAAAVILHQQVEG